MHGLMSGGWRRGTVSGPQRLQLDAWTAPDRTATAPVLDSTVPAVKRVLPNVDHRRHKRLNNRAENSHRPVRKRERAMQRFKSPEQAQRFLETFSAICNHFRPRRHRLSAKRYRHIMRERFEEWRRVAHLAPTV
jgi:hypothetical protein